MIDARTLSRPLLASSFVLGGIQVLRDRGRAAEAADQVGGPLVERFGLPTDSTTLVKVTAGVQIGAGALLALGFLPRTAALALAASLVPTTLAGHRFWEQTDPTEKRRELQAFLQSAGVVGGLVMTALDTGGRPSVFWSGKRAAVRAANKVNATASSAATSVSDVIGQAVHALPTPG